MAAFFHYLAYDFKNGLREKSLLLLNYLFPLGLFIMMGFLLTSVNPDFKTTIIPAMIIISTMSVTLLGMPNPIVADRLAGVYRSFKINGIPAAHILAVPPLGNLVHVIIVSVVITILGYPLFDASLPINWPAFVFIVLVQFFAMAGLGMLIGVISPKREYSCPFQPAFLPAFDDHRWIDDVFRFPFTNHAADCAVIACDPCHECLPWAGLRLGNQLQPGLVVRWS